MIKHKNARYNVSVSGVMERSPDDITIPLEDGKEYSMGRDLSCDIQCNDMSCSLLHCYIRVVKDEIWFTDNYTDYGCYTMLRPPRQMPLIGDSFILGNTLFTIAEEGRAKGKYGILKRNERSTQNYEVVPAQFPNLFIGRDSSDRISVIEDETMSVHHAQLSFDIMERRWLIKDHGRTGKGSSNGTWLRLGTETLALSADDIVRVGKETFIIFRKN